MAVIEYKTGDLLAEKADALVNAVNCVGNVGAGIALQFRKAWPENFRAYTVACRNGQLQPGRMFTFETRQLAPPRYIINFPTKRHWRSSSRLEDIDAGLGVLVVEIRRLGLDSIAIPPLGAGLGGLPWNAVRERIERALGTLPRLRGRSSSRLDHRNLRAAEGRNDLPCRGCRSSTRALMTTAHRPARCWPAKPLVTVFAMVWIIGRESGTGTPG